MTTYTYLVGTAETYTNLNDAVTAAVNVANITTTNTVDILVKGPNTGGPAKYNPSIMTFTGALGGLPFTIQRAQINVKAYDLTDKPVIDGVGGGTTCFLTNQSYNAGSISSFTTTFQGLKFQNWSGMGGSINDGVVNVYGNGAVNVKDCEFYNCNNGEVLVGIQGSVTRTSTIERNKFIDCNYAVSIFHSAGNNVILKNNICVHTGTVGATTGFMRLVGGSTTYGGIAYNNSVYFDYTVGGGTPGASTIGFISTASNNAIYTKTTNPASALYMLKGYYGSYNCLYNVGGGANWGYTSLVVDGGGNITGQNPNFTAPTTGDFSFSKSSPLYNAGTQISSVTDSYNGVARPTTITANSKYDIGAYEYYDISNASRILNLPVRIMIAERDSMTGSYPTIARTGDPDFSGRYPAYFDDTSAVNFKRGSNVLYPILLPSESKHVYNDIQGTTYFQGIVAPGNVTAGTSDAHVHFTPGQSISAFNESRVYLDNDSAFYATGTSSGTLPGFDQRLSSKTILTFDVNPSTSTNVFFSTGSAASQIGSGLAYYNWEARKWEMIGITRNGVTTGSNVDFLNPDPDVRSQAPHAFCGLPNFAASSPLSNTARHAGRPHSTHGFPFATQFDPTGSQVLSVSSSITGPFMLEKAVFEWSGSFHPWPASTLADGPLTYNFFLMSITPVSDAVTIVQDLTGSSDGINFTSRSKNFSTNYIKDIVWTGEIARVNSALYNSNPTSYGRDLTLVTNGADSTAIPAVTGTFKVESPARIYEKNEGLITLALRNDFINVPLLSNKIGFRNLAGYVEGKSVVRPIGSSITSGTIFVDGNLSTKRYLIPYSAELSYNSPYIILPNHKFILGFSCQPVQGAGDVTNSSQSSWSEQKQSTYVTTLAPGVGKLTLYGSLLQDGKPKDTELNQPLTSNAIHEDLHYDNPIFDQFDVEPFEAFNGTYIDEIVTGSMLATPLGDPTAPNVRAVQAKCSLGQAGTTGSLQRFVSFPDTYGTAYDSYPPNPINILKKNNIGLLYYPSDKTSRVAVGIPSGNFYIDFMNSAGLPPKAIDTSWYLRSAYEVENQRFIYTSFQGLKNESYDNLNGSHGQQTVTEINTAQIYGKLDTDFGDSNYNIANASDKDGNTNSAGSKRESTKWLFGFGDYYYNLPTPTRIFPASTNPAESTANIRGYKYGLAGLFGSVPDARFRRDRYGQFRDMLEQRRYPATLLPDRSVDYPVTVKFVKQDDVGSTANPIDTHSQNLSYNATSSVPYYDGFARDRDDDPDETLRPYSVTSRF